MKVEILSFSDGNMAGYEWSWSFFASRTTNGRFTLSCRQTVQEDEPMEIPPVAGLRDAAEIYEALSAMVDEAGWSLPDLDQKKIAVALSRLDPGLESAFLAAPKWIEEREEKKSEATARKRKQALAPFQVRIDAYVTRFSDQKLKFPWPSQRTWAKRFIQEYVVTHGHLPTGKHRIEVAGYHGGEHDFSDLKKW